MPKNNKKMLAPSNGAKDTPKFIGLVWFLTSLLPIAIVELVPNYFGGVDSAVGTDVSEWNVWDGVVVFLSLALLILIVSIVVSLALVKDKNEKTPLKSLFRSALVIASVINVTLLGLTLFLAKMIV